MPYFEDAGAHVVATQFVCIEHVLVLHAARVIWARRVRALIVVKTVGCTDEFRCQLNDFDNYECLPDQTSVDISIVPDAEVDAAEVPDAKVDAAEAQDAAIVDAMPVDATSIDAAPALLATTAYKMAARPMWTAVIARPVQTSKPAHRD